MAELLRGEIRWANIEDVAQVVGHEQGNSRPALILSNDQFNAESELVIAALISSSNVHQHRYTSHEIRSVRMPKQPSWVLTDQIRTLSAYRMRDRIGKLDESELR